MPLDPSIFMQGAQLRAQQNAQLLDNINNTMRMASERKLAEAKAQAEGLDPEKLFQKALIKQELGIPLTPMERAGANAYQTQQSAQMAMDPYTGQLYPKFRPIDLGGGAPTQGVQFQNIMPDDAPDFTPVPLPPKPMGGFDPTKPPPLSMNQNMAQGMSFDNIAPLPEESVVLPEQAMPQRVAPVNPNARAMEIAPDNPRARLAYLEGFAKKTAESDVDKGAAGINRERFQKSLDLMAAKLEQLREQGGITEVGGNLLTNLGATMASGQSNPEDKGLFGVLPKIPAGQDIQRAIATPQQALRDSIVKTRDQLLPQIMQATGAGSKMFDSNAERIGFLQSIFDPRASYQANMEVLQQLSRVYGTGQLGQKGPEKASGPVQVQNSNLPEGATATNSKTGERIIVRGGQWQKM